MNYTKEQLVQFWVGLMDGDGSIQVNHWQQKYLQYRLVIKLKYTAKNEQMLRLIATVIGGTVRKEKEDEFIVWVVNDKKAIMLLVNSLKQYPPLTTRLQLQIKFLEECMTHNSITKYLEARNQKYNGMRKISDGKLQIVQRGEFNIPTYFDIWLSGFVEAEGCFTYRLKQKIVGFSISQKNDRYLIEVIKTKLGITSLVQEQSKDQWTIETTRSDTVRSIIKHFEDVPLLGEKKVSLEVAKERLYKPSNLSKHTKIV